MKVTIMYRNSFIGGDGWEYHPKTIEIGDTCPVCGGPRGEPYGHNFVEDGVSYYVEKWDNPCGHLDKYKDVYHESIQLKKDEPEKALIGDNGDGSFCLYLEDNGKFSKPIGKFPSKVHAERIANINGYEVEEVDICQSE